MERLSVEVTVALLAEQHRDAESRLQRYGPERVASIQSSQCCRKQGEWSVEVNRRTVLWRIEQKRKGEVKEVAFWAAGHTHCKEGNRAQS